MPHPPHLAIVIPCYNEQAVLPHTLQTLVDYLQSLVNKNKIDPSSFLYCVDDGSHDETWHIITTWHQTHPNVKGLKLTRNVGHQYALLAGLQHVRKKVDCAITLDADLQDDIRAIESMIDHYQMGHDIVYGIRQSRKKDSFFKRLTASAFYRLMKMSGADIHFNHADFRLLSQRVLMMLNQFKERNVFLRGLFPLMGYRTAQVHYERLERQAGTSKYTFKKMLALAWDGLTSFGHLPLNVILFLGLFSFALSVLLIGFVLCSTFFSHVVPGWASIMIPLCFMGGIQLFSIGILGEYIAKVYLEVKRRPYYVKDVEL